MATIILTGLNTWYSGSFNPVAKIWVWIVSLLWNCFTQNSLSYSYLLHIFRYSVEWVGEVGCYTTQNEGLLLFVFLTNILCPLFKLKNSQFNLNILKNICLNYLYTLVCTRLKKEETTSISPEGKIYLHNWRSINKMFLSINTLDVYSSRH